MSFSRFAIFKNKRIRRKFKFVCLTQLPYCLFYNKMLFIKTFTIFKTLQNFVCLCVCVCLEMCMLSWKKVKKEKKKIDKTNINFLFFYKKNLEMAIDKKLLFSS